MSEGLVSTCVMVNWVLTLFSVLSTTFFPFSLHLLHTQPWDREKPQCSWHPQASILSMQVMDRYPGFEITNLGFSLILSYKPTREGKNLS